MACTFHEGVKVVCASRDHQVLGPSYTVFHKGNSNRAVRETTIARVNPPNSEGQGVRARISSKGTNGGSVLISLILVRAGATQPWHDDIFFVYGVEWGRAGTERTVCCKFEASEQILFNRNRKDGNSPVFRFLTG